MRRGVLWVATKSFDQPQLSFYTLHYLQTHTGLERRATPRTPPSYCPRARPTDLRMSEGDVVNGHINPGLVSARRDFGVLFT